MPVEDRMAAMDRQTMPNLPHDQGILEGNMKRLTTIVVSLTLVAAAQSQKKRVCGRNTQHAQGNVEVEGQWFFTRTGELCLNTKSVS